MDVVCPCDVEGADMMQLPQVVDVSWDAIVELDADVKVEKMPGQEMEEGCWMPLDWPVVH